MIIKNGKRIDGCSDTVPVGTLNPFIGSVAPYGYLICEGQLVSKITYKELYMICGSTFGPETDNGFYLPDLRGKTITGYKEGDSNFGTLGALIGNLTHIHSTGDHTLTIDEIPSHQHMVKRNYGGAGFSIPYSDNVSGWRLEDTNGTNCVNTANAGGGQSHNHGNTGESSNLQPSINMNWIVKAFVTMPNQSFVENNLESDSVINSLSAAQGKELVNRIKDTRPVVVSMYLSEEQEGEDISIDDFLSEWFQEEGHTMDEVVKQLDNIYDKTAVVIDRETGLTVDASVAKLATYKYGYSIIWLTREYNKIRKSITYRLPRRATDDTVRIMTVMNESIPLDSYPVGSIYMSIYSTSPADEFGGTWERIMDTFLLAGGEAFNPGTTGGEINHTLTIDEMPSHTHFIPSGDGQRNADAGSNWQYQGYSLNSMTKASGGSGGGLAHNNMPPYLAIYVWKRIA